MAYQQNNPFGLKPIGHLQGGSSNITQARGIYVIDQVNPVTLNKGDPVSILPTTASITGAQYILSGANVITLYNPTVTLAAGGGATTFANNRPIVGVFMGCKYKDANGALVEQEYWVGGTPTTSAVKAIIYDDPDILWEVQLSTYFGSDQANPTRFLVLPSMQIESAAAGWPNTGTAAGVAGVVGSSAIIGTNVMLLTGRGPAGAAGGTTSLTTIQRWDAAVGGVVVAGYLDNPLIANYGTNNVARNPLGVSTFYGCPSLAGTNANPSVTNGGNEYVRDAQASFKVLGFSNSPENVPDTYGQPNNVATAGTYFNTPFLTVYGIINNHAFRPGSVSVTPA